MKNFENKKTKTADTLFKASAVFFLTAVIIGIACFSYSFAGNRLSGYTLFEIDLPNVISRVFIYILFPLISTIFVFIIPVLRKSNTDVTETVVVVAILSNPLIHMIYNMICFSKMSTAAYLLGSALFVELAMFIGTVLLIVGAVLVRKACPREKIVAHTHYENFDE